MRLEYLAEIELTNRSEFALVKPYGTEEGTGFGEAGGEIRGERLTGTIRCANTPHRRSDGTMLPDTSGVIETTDGATVVFRMRGRTTFGQTDDGPRGRQLLYFLFEAQAPRYQWLNAALCVLEGSFNPATRRMVGTIYECVGGTMAPPARAMRQ